MSDPVRLSKRLIEVIGCSRREAELYIEGGWLTVDGVVIDEPQFKVDAQAVALLPGATATPLEPVTLLANWSSEQAVSPETLRAVLNPDTRWADDPADKRVLKGHFARLAERLPLQAGAEGLVIFTQDWRTTRKLDADAYKLEQEYAVEISGEMKPGGLEQLKRGQAWKGQPLPAAKASWQNETRLRLVLKNPQPGVIRALCASVGLHVRSMKRLRVGGVSIGKVPSGAWRYLGSAERF